MNKFFVSVVFVLAASACGGDAKSERSGITACGSKVSCAASQFCADPTTGDCESGCLTDQNCAANQQCGTMPGGPLGTCVAMGHVSSNPDLASSPPDSKLVDDALSTCNQYDFDGCDGPGALAQCKSGVMAANVSQLQQYLNCANTSTTACRPCEAYLH